MSIRLAAVSKFVLVVIILSALFVTSVAPAFAVHNRLRQGPNGYYYGYNSWSRNR